VTRRRAALRFHMARALSLGQAAGDGLVADRGHDYEALLRPRVLLGPAHPIAGDGRTSWGPADPLAAG
jgi:hypothetical protein